MDNLVCTECGTTYYSAAADTMIARGERCDCGGRLRQVHQEAEVPVGGPPAPAANGGKTPPPGGRRFTSG
jgi:predicted  nucleic acid-binding Zn-ribbon protein